MTWQHDRLFILLWILCATLHAQPPLSHTPPWHTAKDPAIATTIDKISSRRIQSDIETLVRFGTRSTLSSEEQSLPQNHGILPAADWIEAQFQSYSAACGGCLEIRRDAFVEPGKSGSRILQPTRLVNVYAILRGHDPAQQQRMYLVTGHYDSRVNDVMDSHSDAPGANDDASGVAVSLECARVLSQMKLPATLVFVAVAGEEQGLNGSTHLAKLAHDQGWHLDGVLNNDIVGGDRSPGQNPHTVRVFSEGMPATATPEEMRRLASLGAENDSPARELARTIEEVGATYLSHTAYPFYATMVFRRDRFLRGGDHLPFSAQGFPAVRFTEWQENFQHQHQSVRMEQGTQYGDLLQFVDTNYVAHVAQLNAATLAMLAAAPGPPQKVRMLTSSLDHGTELNWSAPEGAPADMHYQVLWRSTDQAQWQNGKTTQETHLRLNVSKDNVIFGVRSVDKLGHASVAVLPLPQR